MRRGGVVLAVLAALAAAGSTHGAALHATCSSSYTQALVGGVPKCLRAGEYCSPGAEPDYERYGFSCVAGRLQNGGHMSPATPAAVVIGRTVTLASRTRSAGCRRSALPDRSCSPGAYYNSLTRQALCAPSFRTSAIRSVPQSEKFAVEREYGMVPGYYGRSIEIDHVVPLELGGSNDIANLFPEPASYRMKDRLENRLHDLVCAGRINLAAARRGIAANWEREYRVVFGIAP